MFDWLFKRQHRVRLAYHTKHSVVLQLSPVRILGISLWHEIYQAMSGCYRGGAPTRYFPVIYDWPDSRGKADQFAQYLSVPANYAAFVKRQDDKYIAYLLLQRDVRLPGHQYSNGERIGTN